jgi:hypothetical protein
MFVSNKRIHDHHKGNGDEKQPLKQEKKKKGEKIKEKRNNLKVNRYL